MPPARRTQQAWQRRRQRIILRIGAACVVLAGMAVWFADVAPVEPPVVVNVTPQPITKPAAVTVARIATDPTLVDRLAISPRRSWRTIGDEELLSALADAGQPAGLVEFNGRTLLLPHKPAHR